ncbi:DNA alkylation repair protein [Ekhidna sp.]|uniref:DNA alkylation repair protein n=1 Tax=Ekhidna sp. TaxID=2608089 RepID=UPI0032991113
MKTLDHILKDLNDMADPEYISTMEYFGIKGAPKTLLGIKNAFLKPYAKELGKSQELACKLWDQNLHECKLLAIHVSEPKKFTREKAEKWISECYSWDLVDGLGMRIISKTDFAYDKVKEWSSRQPEYEKRMAFAVMVGLSLASSKLSNENIERFFPIIEKESWDDRNFVKKAVNWALRQIGKRNLALNAKAIEVAEQIKLQNTKPARWIAADALRELKSDKIQSRLKSKKS